MKIQLKNIEIEKQHSLDNKVNFDSVVRFIVEQKMATMFNHPDNQVRENHKKIKCDLTVKVKNGVLELEENQGKFLLLSMTDIKEWVENAIRNSGKVIIDQAAREEENNRKQKKLEEEAKIKEKEEQKKLNKLVEMKVKEELAKIKK